MKFLRQILCLVFFQTISFSILACGLSQVLPFCNTILLYDYKVYEVEVLNKYNSYNPNGFPTTDWLVMDVKVNFHIYGLDTLSSDTITIRNGADAMCQVNIEHFEIGDTLVIAFESLYSFNDVVYPTSHFYQGFMEYLFVEGDSIFCRLAPEIVSFVQIWGGGGIGEGVFSMDYQTFLDDIEQICFDLTPLEELENEVENIFSIFPNPTTNNFQIENAFSEKVNYQLFDASGQLVQEGSFFQQNNYEVEMIALPQGVYFMKIQSGEYSSSEKIVKM